MYLYNVLVTLLCLTLCYPIDYCCQAPLFMEFSKQEYWSRLPFPSPGTLPTVIDSSILNVHFCVCM